VRSPTPLDHVTPEGIKELGEAVNQFILWNRGEIILDVPTMPQNQLMSPLSQTTTLKDNEAPLPMSSPLVPKFKEASLPLSPKEKEVSTLPTSPVKVMPQQDLGHQEQDLPPSSPYNIIHRELDLYNPSTRSGRSVKLPLAEVLWCWMATPNPRLGWRRTCRHRLRILTICLARRRLLLDQQRLLLDRRRLMPALKHRKCEAACVYCVTFLFHPFCSFVTCNLKP
jgi:hypothetical protein